MAGDQFSSWVAWIVYCKGLKRLATSVESICKRSSLFSRVSLVHVIVITMATENLTTGYNSYEPPPRASSPDEEQQSPQSDQYQPVPPNGK